MSIGYKRLEDKLATDEREPACRFWCRLDELSAGFIFDQTCQNQKSAGSIKLSEAELAREKELLTVEFSKYPHEEEMEQLAFAAYSWILCCRMEQFKNFGETEQEAKLRYCKEWALYLGVV